MKLAGLYVSAVKRDYFYWLCDVVTSDLDNDQFLRHIKLIKYLYTKPFRWFVPNDDNRAFEGMSLRRKFCESRGISFDYDLMGEELHSNVTMLELLISLSTLCRDLVYGLNDNTDGIDEWFWRLLINIDLHKYTDDVYNEDEVDEILENVIERRYSRNGKGGLFPLEWSRKDQRKVELWYQMSEYLVRNFYIN
jgi:hypothetical protein